MERLRDEISINVHQSNALILFSRGFDKFFRQHYTNEFNDIVILCIGTDRSTGDCLGPLVGHKLKLIPYKKYPYTEHWMNRFMQRIYVKL